MSTVERSLSHKISNASVFAAMMVVAIHTTGRPLDKVDAGTVLWWFEVFGHWGIFLIAVPFFFLCSGYFLAGHMTENCWWRHECLKRIRTLLVPYLSWGLLYAMLPFVIFFLANLFHGRFAFMQANFNFVDTFGIYPFKLPCNTPLWYIRALLFFVLISPVLTFVSRGGGLFVAVVYCNAIYGLMEGLQSSC